VVVAAQAAERVPVVAVTPFKQFFDMGRGWDAQVMAVRDQVVAELVRDYDCVVLNRSYSYSVALEDAIKRLSAISETDSKPEIPYAADYSFTGMFQPGVTNVECVLRMADLRGGGAGSSSSRVVTVGVSAVDRSAPLIAREIAQAVGAAPRIGSGAYEGAGASARVWAALPFMLSGAGKDNPNLSAELRLRAEIALQSDSKVRLVDRTAFEKILGEQTMGVLSDARDAGRAARMVGADHLLLGRVTAERGNGFRIDLLCVDAVTAEVLSAVTARSHSQDSLGSDVEKAAVSLLAALRTPSRLSAALSDQRTREARLYLETACADAKMHALSGNLAVIEFAEMAYLVARDSPVVVGEIVKALRTCNCYENRTSVKFKGQVAEVADRIIRPFPDVARSADVLLARAQAHAAGGNFEIANGLIRQFCEAYPDRMDADVRRVRGECLLGLGQPRDALAALAKDDDHFRTLLIRLRAFRALGDEEQEFALMDTMTHFQLRDLFARYLELLAKRKGPKSAVEYIDLSMKRDMWLSARPDIRFLQAKFSLRAGDQARAAGLCQQLRDEGQSNNWTWFYVSDNRAFKAQLESLKQETGASEEMWLKACEVQPFPAECALYLQPLGTVDTNLLERTRASVQTFFGARTEILPMLVLTKEERSYLKESNKFDAAQLLPDTLKRMSVPGDALGVAIITRENICADGYSWIYSRRVGCGVLCSYYVWMKQSQKVREICLRNSVIDNMSLTLGLKGRFPCITAGTGDSTSSMKKKFAYCPDVQKQYKSLNLADEQRRVIEMFKTAGVTIVVK
jgi:tetratricopeptide (TPR) repeat protein